MVDAPVEPELVSEPVVEPPPEPDEVLALAPLVPDVESEPDDEVAPEAVRAPVDEQPASNTSRTRGFIEAPGQVAQSAPTAPEDSSQRGWASATGALAGWVTVTADEVSLSFAVV